MAVSRKRVKKDPEVAASPATDDLVRLCARAAEDKKGMDIVILDLTGFTYVTDYLLIVGSANPRQMKAISGAMQAEMAAHGVKPAGVEGSGDSRWMLLDYVDFVVHLFTEEARALYDLELLWGDAPRLAWEQPKRTRKKAADKTDGE